jgi:spermidine/putrescine transport system ATP-binding protein
MVRADVNGHVGTIWIGVRPEKVRLGEQEANRLTGTVKETAYIGVATQVVVETSAGEISVFHQNADPGATVAQPGAGVTVSWAPESTFVVDKGEVSSE